MPCSISTVPAPSPATTGTLPSILSGAKVIRHFSPSPTPFSPSLLKHHIEADWLATRLLNLAIFAFCWFGFCFLLAELNRYRRLSTATLAAASLVFVTAQVCLDQVSRVGPDQLVAALFFVASALLLRLRRQPTSRVAALLGLTLGIGFLVKAVFLVLGCVVLAAAFLAGARRRRTLPAAAVFAGIVLSYGAVLSHAVGYRTLGEAGSLNYAWHVDRLAKWVHWQGGADPAEKAWPKASVAGFARWQADPPDFGRPVHPTERLGAEPTVLVFGAPVQATYTPYYDPAYFYQGYHPVFRWRYQVIALGKNMADLLQVVLTQPISYALALILLCGFGVFVRTLRALWPMAACAVIGILVYLPVHLEGRYLSAFFAVLAVLLLMNFEARGRYRAGLLGVLFVAGSLGIVRSQAPVWSRVLRGWSPHDNVEWRTAEAVQAAGPARGSEVGMISWTPNLHADWAYMCGVRITSEIASGPDEAAFWASTPARQAVVLDEFRRAGATAVMTQDPPRDGNSQWVQVASAPMWVHRF